MDNLNAKWEPTISLDEFNAKPSRGDRVVLPCLCGEPSCQGWAAVEPTYFEMMRHMSDFADAAAKKLTE